MVNSTIYLDPTWLKALGVALVLSGLALVRRGLWGRRGGEQSLTRRGTAMLGRIEGFRLMVFGLVLIGVGAAAVTQQRWLLLLALGIGFVEILESDSLIAFWPAGGDRIKARRA